MKIHVIDPLMDSRWEEIVVRHPNASAFHERGWLETLNRTYGYEPYVLTSSPFDRPLEDGIVVCRVSSWITGARLVSLPFSDHCAPLLRESDETPEFIRWMQGTCDLQNWKYVELRPLEAPCCGSNDLQASSSYWFHELDLNPGLDELFGHLHVNSFRRKVKRAEREGLACELGRSEQLMHEFYRLHTRTRRRQRLLPQPWAWFRNLRECMRDKVQIIVARRGEIPVAAILTLRHGPTVVYKYGCSDQKFHNLGSMPFLIWKLIEGSKASGAQKIDFGRTDLYNKGLTAFKDRIGARKKLLTYYRYTKTSKQCFAGLSHSRALRQFFALLPETLCSAAGRILYRHLG